MSETWGPRAHPGRCDEMDAQKRRIDNNIEWQWLVLVALGLGGLSLWRWWGG